MEVRNLLEDIGVGSLYILTVAQVELVFRIANLVLACLISLIVLISRTVDWWKKAHADGKITKEEIKEGIGIIKEGVEEIKDHIDNK